MDKTRRWTPSQNEAIETLDRDVVVAAGAGSGKTGVLSERYLRIVSRSLSGDLPECQSASIGEILVITFTEKATREMRSRIAQSLTDAGLHMQRRELENGFLSTFHSFCSRLLKENPFEAGVDPEFTVLDEQEAPRMVRQAFEDALDAAFEASDEEIISLAAAAQNERVFGVDNSDPISVLGISVQRTLTKLRGSGWREEDLRELLDEGVDKAADEALKEVVNWSSATLTRLLDCRGELVRHCRGTIGQLETKRQNAIRALSDVKIPGSWIELGEVLLAVNALRSVLSGSLKPRRNAPAEDNEIATVLERAKSACKELDPLKDFSLESETEARGYCFKFLNLCLRTWERYSELKHIQGVLDNEDLPAEAVHMLETSESVCSRYRRKFKHILVDEFQDTDPLQVRLISALHNPGSEGALPNCLFRVGDIQQSIYAFRNADPAIFQDVVAESGSNGSLLVSLRENFRSRPQILRFVNRIFEHAWRETPGRFTALEPGAEFLDKSHHSIEVVIGSGAGGTDLYRDREAQEIARRIQSLVRGGFRLTDPREDETGRHLQYGDIAVLFRAITNVDKYERAFTEAGIPYFVVGGGRGYYARFEIRDVMNLLTVLDAPLDDAALLAALRSPAVGLDVDTIYALTRFAARGARTVWQPLYPAIPAFLESPDSLEMDRARLRDFYEKIEEVARVEAMIPVGSLLERLVVSFDLDKKLLIRPNGRRRLANLRKLLQMANSTNVHGVGDFIRRLREIEKVSEREGDAPTEEEESDVVKLITVHKAKGLEFPVVFIADMARQPARGDSDVFVCNPRTAAVGCKMDRYSSAAHHAINASQQLVQREESLRLLYVAITRSMEHLALYGQARLRDSGTGADLVFPQCGVIGPPSEPYVHTLGDLDEVLISPFAE